MDKYRRLRKKGTNGANYGLETDDVIERLNEWDRRYGIDVSEVESDTVTVHFKSLPEDVASLAAEIYEFCPDTIDQHFGLFDEVIEGADEREEELPDEIMELVDGIDFEDDDFGLELLKRSLSRDRMVGLWWD